LLEDSDEVRGEACRKVFCDASEAAHWQGPGRDVGRPGCSVGRRLVGMVELG
jgi:hypothetical protein